MIKTFLFCLFTITACANESDDLSIVNQQAAALAASYQSQVQSLSQDSLQQSTAYDREAQSLVAQNGKALPTPSSTGVMVFVSLGMPTLVLRQIIVEANALSIPVIIRGLLNNDFKQSAKALYAVLHPKDAPAIQGGVSIDPEWFKTFGITQVPAVVAIGSAPLCAAKDCPPPPFDVVYGNIPLPEALKLIATQGDAAQDIAAGYLQKWGNAHAD